MSKTKPLVDASRQLSLPIEEEPCSSLRAGVGRSKEGVREAFVRTLAGRDRERVAAELSRLVGENISVHTVNSWCAEGKNDRRIPLEYVAALVLITGDVGLIEAALPHGYKVLRPEDVPYYELGRLTVEERERRARKRALLESVR